MSEYVKPIERSSWKGVNIRFGTSTSSSIIGRVAHTEEIEIVPWLTQDDIDWSLPPKSRDGQWVCVTKKTNNNQNLVGYVAAWLLELVDAQDILQPPNEPIELPEEYPSLGYACADRALNFDYEPLFVRLPVLDPGAITSFGGFGPNNFSWLTWYTGGDYYRNLSGLHNGLDFGLRVGTKLCAADWGVVVHVSARENDNPYAAGPYSVIVRHGDHVALYGHARGSRPGVDVFVKEGDVVGPGDVLCVSGSGNGFAHLHFELRKIGTDYIKSLAADNPTHANERFHLRGWVPETDYYINPASFFLTPLESYTWPSACRVSVDTDGNGYPDRVVRAGEAEPVAYDLYSVKSIPATGVHFWRGSRVR